MSKPIDCTSCLNGANEPEEATGYLRGPREAIERHGKYLCDGHCMIVMEDWPEANITDLPAGRK